MSDFPWLLLTKVGKNLGGDDGQRLWVVVEGLKSF